MNKKAKFEIASCLYNVSALQATINNTSYKDLTILRVLQQQNIKFGNLIIILTNNQHKSNTINQNRPLITNDPAY